jgi:hypothetical protein
MKKKTFLLIITSFALTVGAFVCFGLKPNKASADLPYDPAYLISDSLFTDYGSMASGTIQTFLSSHGSGLAGYADVEDCGPSNGAHYSYYQRFYHCGQSVSAATIIYDAAQAYQISPKAILATLQKEQSLVTTPNPTQAAINCAMGYLSCNSNYSGFFLQVDNGAWQFRYDMEGTQHHTSWNGWSGMDSWYASACGGANSAHSTGLYAGNTVTFYNPGGTPVTITIANPATATLYCYTPYVGPYSQTGYSGSYNFVISYETWFGSTTAPQYSWQILGVDYSSGTNTFGSNTASTATVIAKNTSSVPWYNYGDCPVRLGTWLPGRSSPLYSPGWLSPSRPANMNENQVAPGGTATFTVPINSGNLGTYVEAWNLVVENSQWMPWPGLSPTINIVNSYQWQVSSVSYGNGTGLMAPGTSQTITVKALNTGLATWTNGGGPPIRLGTWTPTRQSSVANGWIDNTRAVNMTEDSVAPGQIGTFQFSVYVPNSGLYYERMNLVAEGQTWFNDAGLTLYLQGGTYAWQPLWSSPSTSNWTMAPGTNFVLTIQVKNTGNITWYKNRSFPVRLGTDGPQNRGSALYTPSWLNPIRPASLVQDEVPPGGEGTFTFNAVSPSSSGKRFEAFNLVAEGILWFNDPGYGVYITSL